MYSKKIIKSKLDAIQNRISLRPLAQQYTLTYYTVSQSRFFTNYLLSKIEGKYIPGKPKSWKFPEGSLTQAELNFIDNETYLCQNDFLYYATHYAFVKDAEDDTSPISLFDPWISQRIVLDVWAEAEELFHAIMMLYLKARQLGISTINELAIAHRIQFFSYVNAFVASSDPTKTKKMALMMKLVWDNMPPWLIGEYIITQSKEIWASFPQNNSSITCEHGTAMSGIARGDAPNVFHLSEIPDFNDPDEDIDAALLNAIHERPSTFGVLESTAKGKTGKGKWWYNKWQYAKTNYYKNRTRLRPVFLPWYVGVDIYPTKTWARQFLPKPLSTYTPSKETTAHALACERYTQESPLLKKYLGADWKLPLRQQFFWEFTRAEFKENDKLYKFLEELPASDAEAFQNTGKRLLSAEQEEYLRNHIKPLASYYGKPAVFAIIGEGIPPEHEPDMDDIDIKRPYITVKSNWNYEEKPKIYRLVPLHHDPNRWENRLFIWEFPFPKQLVAARPLEDKPLNQLGPIGTFSSSTNITIPIEYALGTDGAEGLDGAGDNCALEVIKKGNLLYPAEQVAEFVSPNISTPELLPFNLALGTFYSINKDDEINQCRQVVEVNFGGYALQHNLALAGWSNFHSWQGAYDQLKLKTTHRIGWQTNAWTRSTLLLETLRLIKCGFFRLNSLSLIEEIASLQRDFDDNQKIEAKGSDHDDRFFSAGPAFFSLHVQEIYLMSKGDQSITAMFKSHKDELPDAAFEELSPETLAQTIASKEKSQHIEGKVNYYIIDNRLPTLD